MKILAVDDSITNRLLMKEILKGFIRTSSLNFNIEDLFLAENGAEAVKMCETERFDVIFMDIEMPVMNGFDATKKIKQTNNVHVIALTTHYFKTIEDSYYDAGFDKFFPKPINRTELLNHLQSLNLNLL